MPKTALVISAHAADFVWRCGGAIALHQSKGYEVTVVCLSFGERGESAKLWKQEGMTLEKVKTARRKEAENAAKALDAHDIQFFDLRRLSARTGPRGEVPAGRRDPRRAARLHAEPLELGSVQHRPHVRDAGGARSRMIAQAWGHNPGQKVLGAPQLYLFEPHQTEQMGWKPDVFLDISAVWDKKRAAIECMQGQEHLWHYYTNVAENRANHFRRNSGGQSGGRDGEPCGRLPVGLPAHRG